MSRFLLKVALLTVVPAALVAVVAPSRALESVRAISPLRYQVYRAAALGDAIRTIALGDSHAALGFRSADPSVYSLAFPGDNLAEIALTARFAAATLPATREVFLQADPHMFFPQRSGGPRDDQRLLFEGGDGVPKSSIGLMLDPCCRGEIPGVALKSFLGIPVALPIPEIGPTGFSLYPDSLRFRGDFAADARREVAGYGHATPDAGLQRRFSDLVAELRARGIDVVLTRYPLSPEYREALGAEAFAAAGQFLASLDAAHGARGCGAWDVYDDRSLFFNSDHLAPDAADRYWADVLSRCLVPSGGPIPL
jgi:hypothetical protein